MNSRKQLANKYLKQIEYVGTGTTAESLAKVVHGAANPKLYAGQVKPILDALYMTGELDRVVTRSETFYYIAK